MSKQEFLARLRNGLSGLPENDVEERLSFYSEMIQDLMEDGLSETEAVSAVGSVDDIIEQVVAETPLVAIARERIKLKRRMSTAEIILLILGSPIWLSLLIGAFAVILSLYICLLAVVVSLWSIFASFSACFVGGVIACSVFVIGGNGASGLAMLGIGLVCFGLAVFMLYGCKAATNGTIILTKKMGIWLKNRFIRKEVAR